MEDMDISSARRELRELKKGKGREMAQTGDRTPMESKWHDMIKQLEDLSTSTVKANNDLILRISELEEELVVWKQARSQLIQEHVHEKQVLQEELKVMEKRLQDVEVSMDSMILCVIDGDGNIFNNSLLASGLEGGRDAGRALTQGIDEYLKASNLPFASRGRLTLWLTVYFNKKGLQETLIANNVCSMEQFEGFLTGLSQASPRFSLVDVGPGKEAADAKIKEYLQTYARFPQTAHIFFGGGHDNGYLPTLTALQSEHLLDKIVLLKGYCEIAHEIRALSLPFLNVENLFRPTKLLNSPRKQPVSISPLPPLLLDGDVGGLSLPLRSGGSSVSSGSLGTFYEHDHTEAHKRSDSQTVKKLNPFVAIHKKDKPPPCSEYYLLKRCPRGDTCKYGHDYVLSDDELNTLKTDAKSSPCSATRKGLDCQFGNRCIWGHKCPNGPNCYNNSTGKCRFKGLESHTLIIPLERRISLFST